MRGYDSAYLILVSLAIAVLTFSNNSALTRVEHLEERLNETTHDLEERLRQMAWDSCRVGRHGREDACMRAFKNVFWSALSEHEALSVRAPDAAPDREFERTCCESNGGEVYSRRCGWTNQIGLCELTRLACPANAVYARVSYNGESDECMQVGVKVASSW